MTRLQWQYPVAVTEPEGATPSWSPDREPVGGTPEGPRRLPAPGDILGGRFLLRALLGSGGSGLVFAAFDERVRQRVAVKVIHPNLASDEALKRLRREVQAARQRRRTPHGSLAR